MNIKKIASFFSAFLLIWGVIFFYNRFTDGFSVGEMTSSLPPRPQFALEPLGEKRTHQLQTLLDQKFTYLGKGCQFYAFQSDDGRYVLKFFKHKHLRPLTWTRDFPLPQKMRAYCESQIAKREERVNLLFSSIKLAFEELPEETGLLHIHLDRTPDFDQKVTLVDKIGLKHTIALNDYEFVLQKRAINMREAFSGLLEQEDLSSARKLVRELSTLVKERCAKGIADRDRSFALNVAFSPTEEKALFIDVGQFYKETTMAQPEKTHADIVRRLGDLRFWSAQHFPSIVPFIDEELALYSKK